MVLNMKINTHWNIVSRYTDPDTGEKRETIMAFSLSESYAKLICELLGKSDEEPNRDYFYYKVEGK
jgi:hypothetical protein